MFRSVRGFAAVACLVLGWHFRRGARRAGHRRTRLPRRPGVGVRQRTNGNLTFHLPLFTDKGRAS